MKQPYINSKQARWLVHLTSYDFIIQHRPRLSNPADRLLRRPNYIAKAQKKPSLVQKDLLVNKLKTRPDFDRPRATKPDLPLCKIAKCQLCEIAKAVPNIQPCNTVKPKFNYIIARS
jgi:hypothetical protein